FPYTHAELKYVKEINGQIAFTGKATGTVKIVNTAQDMAKFETGDILVSRSTCPSLAPAMQKASAFVTDLGGLTCHAAIIARELKKPCVVGTKSATRTLNDGDTVEVNANTGKVTILKRKA
ncbi:MAG: phosphoenolpyruvate synthase, partial [Nanoarchaeota archaeon]|nr:phosphoenolpyruvate synthase [Nanoarchaeota archaeon]